MRDVRIEGFEVPNARCLASRYKESNQTTIEDTKERIESIYEAIKPRKTLLRQEMSSTDKWTIYAQ